LSEQDNANIDGPSAGQVANDDGRRDRMQRIRVGLTGLAVVLLIAVLSTIVINRVNENSGGTGAAAGVADVVNAGEEPLAGLGVAPSTPDEKPTTPPSNRPASKP
jgi:hypothetical protein